MKKIKSTLVVALALIAFMPAKAQFLKNLNSTPWIVGIGWNIIDDNGKKEMGSIDLHYSMNGLSYPTTLRVEKGLNGGFSGVFTASYNEYEGRKEINSGRRTVESSTVTAFDLSMKFDFNHLYDLNTNVFNFVENTLDCYMLLGFGYTMRDSVSAYVGNAANANIGIGLNLIAYKNFGVNIEATGRFGLSDFWDTPANYTMYNFGLIYRIGRNNGLVNSKTYDN